MRFTFLLSAVLVLLSSSSFGQDVKIMSWNLLNFSESETERLADFQLVFNATQPELLVVQEVVGLAGAEHFQQQVLQNTLQLAPFVDGNDWDNALFYDTLSFQVISNTPIQTALRDISHFQILHRASNDTLHIFSVHLKASGGLTNQNLRLAEIDSLRKVTDQLPNNAFYLVCGDFNMFGTPEPGYVRLTEPNGTSGHFIDPVGITGSWDDVSFAEHHTQSTRTRQFAGGAAGGLDDRFDMILISPSMLPPSNVELVQSSTTPFGNDGMHYHDSINAQPNTAVSAQIADALHAASDHLPLLAEIAFNAPTSIQEQEQLTVNLFPNPSSGLVYLKFSETIFGQIQVVDMLGQVVLTEPLHGISSTLNLKGMESGIYHLVINSTRSTLHSILYLQ